MNTTTPPATRSWVRPWSPSERCRLHASLHSETCTSWFRQASYPSRIASFRALIIAEFVLHALSQFAPQQGAGGSDAYIERIGGAAPPGLGGPARRSGIETGVDFRHVQSVLELFRGQSDSRVVPVHCTGHRAWADQHLRRVAATQPVGPTRRACT